MARILKTYADYVPKGEAVVCLGNFDGFHRGHQQAVRRAIDQSKGEDRYSILYTFHPHPRSVLAGGEDPLLLFTLDEKKEILTQLPFDYLIFENFTEEFSKRSPESFVQEVLVESLRASRVVVGKNFRFGHRAAGNADLIRAHSTIKITEIDFVRDEQDQPIEKSQVVSSSVIRDLIRAGRIGDANAMLGYPYFLTGIVEGGQRRGSALGFPTANIQTAKHCLPKTGVYCGIVEDLISETYFAGVFNLGTRPTFGESEVSIEAHLIDFSDNLYGRDLRLFFFERLRDETKFDSPQDLSDQIRRDVQESKRALTSLKLLRSHEVDPTLSLTSFDSSLQDFQPFEDIRKSFASVKTI